VIYDIMQGLSLLTYLSNSTNNAKARRSRAAVDKSISSDLPANEQETVPLEHHQVRKALERADWSLP
jgi:hypothetical protein